MKKNKRKEYTEKKKPRKDYQIEVMNIGYFNWLPTTLILTLDSITLNLHNKQLDVTTKLNWVFWVFW